MSHNFLIIIALVNKYHNIYLKCVPLEKVFVQAKMLLKLKKRYTVRSKYPLPKVCLTSISMARLHFHSPLWDQAALLLPWLVWLFEAAARSPTHPYVNLQDICRGSSFIFLKLISFEPHTYARCFLLYLCSLLILMAFISSFMPVIPIGNGSEYDWRSGPLDFPHVNLIYLPCLCSREWSPSDFRCPQLRLLSQCWLWMICHTLSN